MPPQRIYIFIPHLIPSDTLWPLKYCEISLTETARYEFGKCLQTVLQVAFIGTDRECSTNRNIQ